MYQHHDPVSREVAVNTELHALARDRVFKERPVRPTVSDVPVTRW